MPTQSPYVIVLIQDERNHLLTLSRKYASPYRDVVRAKLVLLAADGWQNDQIAEHLDLPVPIVSKWRRRFCLERLDGLRDRPRRPVEPADATASLPARRAGRRGRRAASTRTRSD